MADRKVETNEEIIESLSKKTTILYKFFLGLFVLVILIWVGMLAASLASMINPGLLGLTFGQSLANLAIILVSGAAFSLLLFNLYLIIKDVAHKRSPFDPIQVKRIRIIALLLLIYVVIDVFSVSFFTAFISGDQLGVINTSSYKEAAFPLRINVGVLISAVIVYGLSIIFEYGLKLQEQSDEVL